MRENPTPRRTRGVTVLDLWAKRGERRGLRWQFRVFDSRRGSYRSKSFADGKKPDGDVWANRTRGRFKLGIDSSGAVPFESVAEDVVANALRHGRDPAYVAYMAQTYKLAGEFINDLRAGDALRGANLFIDSLRDMRHRVIDGIRVRRTAAEAPAASTLNLRMKHLRALGAYAERHELVTRNPFANLELRDLGDHAKPVFTVPELRVMMTKGRGHDWFTAAALYAYSGLRLREATALDWRDIRWDEKRIAVRDGKGSKDRLAFLQPELAAILAPIAKTSGPLLPEASRERTNKGHGTDFAGFLAHCDIDPSNRTIHSFRHTWTAISLAAGVNQFQVMAWLGHAKADITAHYAQTQDRYREATKGWPKTGDGEFYIARDTPKPDDKVAAAKAEKPKAAHPEPIPFPKRA